jgi:uncharacterized protein (DUF608 family)
MIDRRKLLQSAAGMTFGLAGGTTTSTGASNAAEKSPSPVRQAIVEGTADTASYAVSDARQFNGQYFGEYLDWISFPMGGMGAGMACLDGTGGLSKVSVRHRPELATEGQLFAALWLKYRKWAKVLEGSVPKWKLGRRFSSINGYPRFDRATFEARFPFATVSLKDSEFPVEVELVGWSPFIPGDADSASLPTFGLEYNIKNNSTKNVEGIFSFNSANFLAQASGRRPPVANDRPDRILPCPRGFILYGAGAPDQPTDKASFAIWTNSQNAIVDHGWKFDSFEEFWRDFAQGKCTARPPITDHSAGGASIMIPVQIPAGKQQLVSIRAAWYVPNSSVYFPETGFINHERPPFPKPSECYKPWYAGKFADVEAVIAHWDNVYDDLEDRSKKFSGALFDSTLPPEVTEAISANLSILKSTTVLRQEDGRLWGREGSEEGTYDQSGIAGTTTHVWNFAQSIPHLFPELERGLREVEVTVCQNDKGEQNCRVPLPIRKIDQYLFPGGPAVDGQLGGIVKVYREWRISGDTGWVRKLWPFVRVSSDWCIKTWDPNQTGLLDEPHLTTFDKNFWGTDSYSLSLYIAALTVAISIGHALRENTSAYAKILKRAEKQLTAHLFNGEYFIQNVRWKGLVAQFSDAAKTLGADGYYAEFYDSTPEMRSAVEQDGPPGQYGEGCFSAGLMGFWLASTAGLAVEFDRDKVEKHLSAVYRYNFQDRSRDHSTQVGFPGEVGANESGLLSCTWPRGKRPLMPMIYSDGVFSGIEYSCASQMIAAGMVQEGLALVRAVRTRYDGRARNPFAEIEAGYWYARAMSSYSLLQALSGARFDNIEKTLYLHPIIKGDFRCFFAAAEGFGTVGVREGKPFVEVKSGKIPYTRIDYRPA